MLHLIAADGRKHLHIAVNNACNDKSTIGWYVDIITVQHMFKYIQNRFFIGTNACIVIFMLKYDIVIIDIHVINAAFKKQLQIDASLFIFPIGGHYKIEEINDSSIFCLRQIFADINHVFLFTIAFIKSQRIDNRYRKMIQIYVQIIRYIM